MDLFPLSHSNTRSKIFVLGIQKNNLVIVFIFKDVELSEGTVELGCLSSQLQFKTLVLSCKEGYFLGETALDLG